ncbi:MAG: tetratricopeptide repeat protein, partial [Planctomycetota bacterium]
LCQDADPPEREESVLQVYHRALNLLQNKSYAKAEGVFGEVLEIEPSFVLALYCRGACRLGMGRYQGALEDLDAFLRARPKTAKALALRGRAHLALEIYSKADRDLSTNAREGGEDVRGGQGLPQNLPERGPQAR